MRGRKNKTDRRNKLSCGRSQSSILIPFVVAPRRLLKTVTDLSINHLHRLYRIPTWLLRQLRSNQGRITGSSWNWRKHERPGLLQLRLTRMGRKLTLTFLSICLLPLGILMQRDLA